MPIKRAHLYISGRVQGVFFRAWAAESAQRLGLGGWVRNLVDGRVEAVYEGDPAKVERMIELSREGPPHARVDTVQDDCSEPPQGLVAFKVRGTA